MRYGNSAFTVAQNLLTQIRPSIYMKYCVICYREYSDAHGDRQTNKQTNTRAYVGSTTCESAKVNLFAFYRALLGNRTTSPITHNSDIDGAC